MNPYYKLVLSGSTFNFQLTSRIVSLLTWFHFKCYSKLYLKGSRLNLSVIEILMTQRVTLLSQWSRVPGLILSLGYCLLNFSANPDLKPIEHLWRALKAAVRRCSRSNVIALERICQEEWEKQPKSTCAKLVETYPRRLHASTKFWIKGLDTYLKSFQYGYFVYFVQTDGQKSLFNPFQIKCITW